jgi:uncharacterized protein (TIGR03067 family)
MKTALLLALTAGVPVAAKAPGEDAKKELEKLQGDWVLVSNEREGQKTPDEQVKAFRRTIKGDQYTVTRDGKPFARGTIKLDPSKTPRAMDITRTEGTDKDKPMLAIYETDGDTQKVCFAPPGQGRPTEFASKPGSGHVYSVWKRVKK